jgi:putative flippase GtrA
VLSCFNPCRSDASSRLASINGARHISQSGIREQAVRYLISGAILTLIYSTIYWAFADPLHTPPLFANTIGFLAALSCGWVLHSRWTFSGEGDRSKPAIAFARFLAVNLAGYALNSLWVWLIVAKLGANVSLPILPIAVVTPALMFVANKFWTFGQSAP